MPVISVTDGVYMIRRKQNTPNVIRYVGIVGVILASGCASYPSQPPSCGSGEYYPVNPTHMEDTTPYMREASAAQRPSDRRATSHATTGGASYGP